MMIIPLDLLLCRRNQAARLDGEAEYVNASGIMFASDAHELLCLRVGSGKYFESSSKWVLPTAEKSQHRLFMKVHVEKVNVCARVYGRETKIPNLVTLEALFVNSSFVAEIVLFRGVFCFLRTETSCTDSIWAILSKSWSDSMRGGS